MLSGKILKLMASILILIVIISSFGAVFGEGLRVSPDKFNYNLHPSQNVSGEITVQNIGNVPVSITIEKKRLLVDSLHIVYADDGIATWISTNSSNFTLSPGESRNIQFSVNAPSKINYFDAVGAILIRGISSNDQMSRNVIKSNFTINQGVEILVPIIVGFPGPIIESLQLLEHNAPVVLLSFMPGDFSYHIQNNGTVYANMTGNIEINGLTGTQNIPLSGGIFPGDDYNISAQWTPEFWDMGIYSAITTINYGKYQKTKMLQTKDTIIVIPVWLIIILLIAIIFVYIRKKNVQIPIKIEKR